MSDKPILYFKVILLLLGLTSANLSAQQLHQLVMDQHPESLSDIQYNTGNLFSVKWDDVNFKVYEKADTSSTLLIDKKGTVLFKNGISWCEFNSKGYCYSYLYASDSSDLPISHSLPYKDIKIESNKRMWYQIEIGNVIGWTFTPYMYSSSDAYLSTSRDYLISNPYIRWMPTDPDAILLADVGRQVNQPLKHLLNGNRRLEIEDRIRWVGDDPILVVHVVNKLDDYTWCTQRELPKRIFSGLMYMFTTDKQIAVYQVPEIDCD